MTANEQLDLWVAGKPVHDQEHKRCCPDFSCCRPELLAPQEVRALYASAFKAGNEKLSERMLMEFLSRALGPNVYICGQEAARQEIE